MTGDPLPPEERQAIRERCEGLVPGPWEAGLSAATFRGEQYEGVAANGVMLMQTIPAFKREGGRIAQFIAAARTDIPRLLVEVEQLIQERDRQQELNDGARKAMAQMTVDCQERNCEILELRGERDRLRSLLGRVIEQARIDHQSDCPSWGCTDNEAACLCWFGPVKAGATHPTEDR